MGRHGQAILCTLLLDHGVFVSIDQTRNNLHQISGTPIFALLPDQKNPLQISVPVKVNNPKIGSSCNTRRPSQINFIRNRILYARPSLNAQNSVRFGLKHVHVLNRFADTENDAQSIHVLKYIFPMQFGLHNVFTSIVESSETTQGFKDYTLREQEITCANLKTKRPQQGELETRKDKIPKRLRGQPLEMVKAIRRRHARCSYTQLLRHYCPLRFGQTQNQNCLPPHQNLPCCEHLGIQIATPSATVPTQVLEASTPDSSKGIASTLQFTTPAAQVSAFCRAVLRRILPINALGTGRHGRRNWGIFCRNVDAFIRVRRYETFSLHHIFQNLSVECMSWLRPPAVSVSHRLSWSDRGKRTELFQEFLYYLFDSMLIPIIRSHFYVTESSHHRNRLFFFRHDVWRMISEPSLANMRMTMFEGVDFPGLRHRDHSRLLGHSQIRLLPKECGVRPIINLRRKVPQTQHGKTTLMRNINSRLTPCFAVLNFERHCQPESLGAALFSIGEAHQRLRDFRDMNMDGKKKKFYFVKMDVKSCFDTIPQESIVRMAQHLLSEPRYLISCYAELRRGNRKTDAATASDRPLLRFLREARPSANDAQGLNVAPSRLVKGRKHSVFVDAGNSKMWTAASIANLLEEHVQQNVVTIGKKAYRQKQGIPQGSILSSLLCNFFYGSFEDKHLRFLKSRESLLLRVIDDFLLITANEDHAQRFAQVMTNGSLEYGIEVQPKKSLANMELSAHGCRIPRIHGTQHFPFCGLAIDTRTLEFTTSRASKDANVSNGLTVEYSRRPGCRFRQKVLDSVRIQMMGLLLDTSLNSIAMVFTNLYQAFLEAAMKMYRYIRELPRPSRPGERLVLETWQDVADLVVKMTRGKQRSRCIDEYKCAVTRTQIQWLAAAALEMVVRRKHIYQSLILPWLQQTLEKYQACMKLDGAQLSSILRAGDRAFKRFRY